MGKSDSYINEQGIRISKATGKPVAKYTKRNKQYWAKRMGEAAQTVEIVVDPLIAELQSLYSEEEIQGIIGLKKDSAPVELVEIPNKKNANLTRETPGFDCLRLACGRSCETVHRIRQKRIQQGYCRTTYQEFLCKRHLHD